ncbi:ATP-dependent helicase HrpB [Qipengyuania flava]|uniref:ATP-dependent helicase HrpB n=1 Tax=Qipengyuania flava TaxID=192812 RepID=UPI001C5A0F71|nr:ATP-dependent helicase HrpB [Qipengyuania flava]MBW3167904.1 ATP-dependent helicase HrpB [Qipengyuania flava]MBY5965142.1 ATP-dependent helicase HrpB [Qipengyuania flava]MBY6011466.1 ATP-dependent helicase HrpB [Qipengyuania flava]MBY6025908.1 ATP-dependent helicase HrpB [Qipengyuania flava]
MADLPILSVIPELLDALRGQGCGVLVAPPGAGKTTAVAPAMLDQEWCSGTVILTSPRRVAARAAAERMAQTLGEKPGETVGYVTRLDSKRSARTRVLVVTEAIFVNMILADPELAGVSAVLFDEAHERHLDSDLGLALALESRAVLREDLRVLVMSATIDGSRFAELLGDRAQVIESEGRAYPLEIEWLGSSPQLPVEDAMAQAIVTAWREQRGDILGFLPGVREIERVRERLEKRLPDALLLPLHGQVEPAAQRAAIRRDPDGRRRIVLATAIAETSLTLDGVSVVVDAGLSRRAEFDRAAGTTHLVTHRASQAAAAQRAGRAARQGPGVAYRLWEEGGHGGRPPFDPPEMVTADLAPLVLSLAQWGTADPDSLAWLDPPPAASVDAARSTLAALGALDEAGRITERGAKLAQLPLDPQGAATILFGAEHGGAERAARIALLLQERSLGGRGEDLELRLSRWDGDRGHKAEASRKLASRWARRAQDLVDVKAGDQSPPSGVLLAAGRPEFIAKRRDARGEQWLAAGGRGFVLDPTSTLARADFIVVGDAQGQAKGARITAGMAVEEGDLERWFSERIERCKLLRWTGERVEARVERRLGTIVLAQGPDPEPDGDAIVDMLVDKVLENPAKLIPQDLLARAAHAGLVQFSSGSLQESASVWLRPLLEGRRDLKLSGGKLTDALLGMLDWESRKKLDRVTPREFISPAGTSHRIDYAGEDAPSVEVRVQALFGLERHPMIGKVPLLLKLTSPAGRPIQATRDLPGFWRGSWADVRKDMKGRYPKHRWPEEPWAEAPSLKTKNAFSKSGG